MINIRKYKILFLVGITFFIDVLIYGQNEDNLWVFGIGANAIDYYPSNAPNTGNEGGFLNQLSNANDHWNIGGPQILVTRFLGRNLSVDGLLAFNKITKYGDVQLEKSTYIGMDINARYSFIDTTKDFTIFVLAGIGYNSFNPETVWVEGIPIKFGSGGTLNIGGGANYWFSNTLGLNFEALYKSSLSDKLPSHFYYGLSLVFRLNSGNSSDWRNCN